MCVVGGSVWQVHSGSPDQDDSTPLANAGSNPRKWMAPFPLITMGMEIKSVLHLLRKEACKSLLHAGIYTTEVLLCHTDWFISTTLI